jgi:hypothetical protein
MAPDIICLQETIWTPKTFLKEIVRGKPSNKSFLFPQKWTVWPEQGSSEAAILYNPDKFKVEAEVNSQWREETCSIDNGLAARTVALQGKILSIKRDIIVISVHMFNNGYDIREKLAMTNAIISQAQELANEKNMTVIMGGDWNCPVSMIQLTAGAVMPSILNPINNITENDGIDSLIIINPLSQNNQDDRDDQADQKSKDIPPNLTLDQVQFFKWADIVTANDMEGLDPGYIDTIYCLGGKHRPIVANVSF